MASPFDAATRTYMTTPVVTVHASAWLSDAQARLAERQISSLAVVDGADNLVGVLSRTDLLRVGRLRSTMAGAPRLLTLPRARVQERMVADVATVQASTPVREAARLMVERRVHRVFVVSRGRPVGVLSALDVMQAVVQARVATPISAFMSSPVLTAETDEPVARVTDRLGEEHVHGLVVVEDGWPVGVFTQLEALASRQLQPDTPVETVMSCAMLCVPVETPIFRAAGFLGATRARRVLAVAGRRLEGILTGLDLARVVAT